MLYCLFLEEDKRTEDSASPTAITSACFTVFYSIVLYCVLYSLLLLYIHYLSVNDIFLSSCFFLIKPLPLCCWFLCPLVVRRLVLPPLLVRLVFRLLFYFFEVLRNGQCRWQRAGSFLGDGIDIVYFVLLQHR